MFNTAGIDLGIHNPVTICDNNGFHIIQMSQKEIDAIERVEERSKRLKSIV